MGAMTEAVSMGILLGLKTAEDTGRQILKAKGKKRVKDMR